MHSFDTLDIEFNVNDIIIVSVTCIKLAQLKHQLSPTKINSRPAVHFLIPIIAQFQYFLPLLLLGLTDPLDNFAEY